MSFALSILTMTSLFTSSVSIVPCSRMTSQNERIDASNSWVKNPEGDAMIGNYFPNYSFKKVKVFVVEQCWIECKADQRCKSFNHDKSNGECELNTVKRSTVARNTPTWVQYKGDWLQLIQGLIAVPDWDYYSSDALVLKGKTIYNPCKDSNCGDNKVCSPLPPKQRKLESDYSCQSTLSPLADYYVDWSVWSSWSTCSVTCGRGIQSRTRTCPGNHKWKCQGRFEDRQLCEPGICPYWAHWQAWSYCTTENNCGRGNKTKSRTCITDSNLPCPGDSEKTIKCRLPSCDTPIALENGTFGRVFIYDDSNRVLPSWKTVCDDLTWDAATRTSIYRTVCGYNYMYVSDVVPSDPSTTLPQEVFLKPTSCGDVRYLMQCQHDGWGDHPTCTSQLYVSCQADTYINFFVHSLDTIITYEYNRQFCYNKFSEICEYDDIFPNNDNIPILTGTLPGDNWAPLRTPYNDWTQVGNFHPTGFRHIEEYGVPFWTATEIPGKAWATYVFCCKTL